MVRMKSGGKTIQQRDTNHHHVRGTCTHCPFLLYSSAQGHIHPPPERKKVKKKKKVIYPRFKLFIMDKNRSSVLSVVIVPFLLLK